MASLVCYVGQNPMINIVDILKPAEEVEPQQPMMQIPAPPQQRKWFTFRRKLAPLYVNKILTLLVL